MEAGVRTDPGADVSTHTWDGSHPWWSNIEKNDRATTTAGQVSGRSEQTLIPANDDVNATRRGFAQTTGPWDKRQMTGRSPHPPPDTTVLMGGHRRSDQNGGKHTPKPSLMQTPIRGNDKLCGVATCALLAITTSSRRTNFPVARASRATIRTLPHAGCGKTCSPARNCNTRRGTPRFTAPATKTQKNCLGCGGTHT